MKPIKLSTLLKQQGKKAQDTIKWAYFGYGFFYCDGECKITELPPKVKISKCFEIKEGVYFVDGAL